MTLEPISYQLTITVEGTERVIEEILVKPREDDTEPGEEEFEGLLRTMRDELHEKGFVGPLALYRLERTLEASVPAKAEKVDLILP